MKILNLVCPEKSDIKYKISKFPDGQQNIVIDSIVIDKSGRSLWTTDLFTHKVQIKSRLNNWLDLELIACAVASLRELGVEEIHLYTPYIIGARSDRKFEEGGNNYLKDVICPIINSLHFKTVTCIDPHSDVLEACIKNFKSIDNKALVKFFFADKIYEKYEDVIFIAPDGGSLKKIYKLAEQIGYKGDIITCSKDRDTDGALTKTVVPWEEEYFGKDLIIVDDICDDGATFINIAEEIKELTKDFNPPKIYLIVTHGLFSKGFQKLSKYFDGIYCTNSYRDTSNYCLIPNFVKQFDVF